MNYKECVTYIISLAALLLAASCNGHDDLADIAGGEGVAQGTGDAYVTLSLSVGKRHGGTRANPPKGGEGGDGTEAGQSYENAVDFVRVYLFKSDNGVNGDADTPITATADFDNLTANDDGTIYSTQTRRVELGYATYDVVAVVNVDPTELDAANITTLGQLRDNVQTKAWTTDGNGNFSRFVMASADEADLTIAADNSFDNPAVATIDVERHAARVDYKSEGEYTCDDPDWEGAKVEILGAGLVNNLYLGSYMLKRVADKVGDPVEYLGKETADADYIATNYVIDPWTMVKMKSNEAIDTIFKVHYTESEYARYWNDYIKEGTPITKPGRETETGWRRVAYTMENTTAAGETSQMHNTGMVFKARFHPDASKVQAYDGAKYKDGSTFFLYDKKIYADIESIIETFWGGELTLAKVTEEIEKCATAADLKAFAEDKMPKEDPVGYRDSLLSLAEQAPEDWQKKALWENFMRDTYGYERETDTDGYVHVTVSEADEHHTRKLLSPGITVYEDAICYYMWWIRHSEDGNDRENGVMEYAIVRNNIYELEVTGVAGLGSPIIPVDEKIKIRAYVRDWLVLPKETVDCTLPGS